MPHRGDSTEDASRDDALAAGRGRFVELWQTFLQYALIGLTNGALFALIALGYTMVYGIIELINFAHGDVFMLGSFLALTLIGAMAGMSAGTGTIRRCSWLGIGAVAGRRADVLRRAQRGDRPRWSTSRCAARRSWRRWSRPSACRSSS